MSYTLVVLYVASSLCAANPSYTPVVLGQYQSQLACNTAALKVQTPMSDCQHIYCMPNK